MTFEDWMRSERVTYKPSDDSVEDRALRRCWDAAVAAERERWRSAVIRRIPAHERFDDQRAAGNTCRAILRDCGA